MVPAVLFPPPAPSTIQVTAVLVAPVTVATKALNTVPLATVTLDGFTVTLTASGGGDPGFGLVEPLWLPPQPAISMETNTIRRLDCFTLSPQYPQQRTWRALGWVALKLCRGFRDS